MLSLTWHFVSILKLYCYVFKKNNIELIIFGKINKLWVSLAIIHKPNSKSYHNEIKWLFYRMRHIGLLGSLKIHSSTIIFIYFNIICTIFFNTIYSSSNKWIPTKYWTSRNLTGMLILQIEQHQGSELWWAS